MSEAVTTRRAKRQSAGQRQSAGWLIALGVSALVHLGILVAFVVYGRSGEPVETAEGLLDGQRPALLLVPIALPAEVTEIEVTELPTADAPPPLARPWDAPPGERDNPVALTRAPADSDGRDRLSPAPDSGLRGGAPQDHAFRLDRSTLRARLTDGAAEAQPARLRISRRRASPQAIRREPTVGIGDSVRSATPSRAPISPANAAADPALGGEPAGAAQATAPAAPSEAPPLVARADPNPNARHAVGPLDAEAGQRAFDTERSGRPSDDRTQRTASDELHPGITDFSRAAAPRPIALADGSGPSRSPGVVSHPAVGLAPNELGARHPRDSGPDVDERTLDRHYQHYVQEIDLRVQRVLEFPQRLKVRLEQGESIVTFAIDANGRLGEGPRVVKSSGFEEFDAAAVRAVRRSAPFPPPPDSGGGRPFVVSLRVKFDNPVVR